MFVVQRSANRKSILNKKKNRMNSFDWFDWFYLFYLWLIWFDQFIMFFFCTLYKYLQMDSNTLAQYKSQSKFMYRLITKFSSILYNSISISNTISCFLQKKIFFPSKDEVKSYYFQVENNWFTLYLTFCFQVFWLKVCWRIVRIEVLMISRMQ